MHNDKRNNDSMLWMMLPCLLLLGVLFLIGGAGASAGFLLPILIGVFVIAHIWIISGHGDHGENEDSAAASKKSETHS